MNKPIKYEYLDEQEKVLYSKVRVTQSDGSKSFYWQRTENGNQVNNINECRKILYNLPIVLWGIQEGHSIFLVEGEKDVHTLQKQGLIGTTSPGTLVWEKSFTLVLKKANVVILYDNDKAGIRRKELLSKELYGKVKTLRIVDLPNLVYRDKNGLDVSDWFSIGHTKKELIGLVENTPYYTSSLNSDEIVAINFKDLIELEIKKPDTLLSPFLLSQGLALLYAKRGVGKTHMALGIACAVATGGSFLKWHAPIPKKVLYVDGEMSAYSMQSRLQKIPITKEQEKLLEQNLLFITPDLQNNIMPNLSTEQGRTALKKLIDETDLIIIDNLSSLFRTSTENEAESWGPIQEWILDLRRQGKTVMIIHHAGKSGKQRGTSKREDILDVVIALHHPSSYKAQDGAFFEVHFEKSRHFSGDDAESFQAQLFTNENGQSLWRVSAIDTNPEVAQVAKLRKEGKTFVEITNITNLTKSQVETRLAKAKQKGILD